jgi:hypothetical protein
MSQIAKRGFPLAIAVLTALTLIVLTASGLVSGARFGWSVPSTALAAAPAGDSSEVALSASEGQEASTSKGPERRKPEEAASTPDPAPVGGPIVQTGQSTASSDDPDDKGNARPSKLTSARTPQSIEPPTCTDPDNDCIPNAQFPVDNCPDVSNPDQRDSDNDGHGDACDAASVASSEESEEPEECGEGYLPIEGGCFDPCIFVPQLCLD